MARANSGHAAGQNFAAFLHELRKNVGALVVDEVHLLDTELTHLLLPEILTLAAARASRSARPTGTATRATFAATATGATFTPASAGMSTFAARPTLTLTLPLALPMSALSTRRCRSGFSAFTRSGRRGSLPLLLFL